MMTWRPGRLAAASSFVERLRAISNQPVAYLELPGAHHGFDMTDGARTASTATAIGLFLNEIHRNCAVDSADGYAGQGAQV
jgi:hypothetical protein